MNRRTGYARRMVIMAGGAVLCAILGPPTAAQAAPRPTDRVVIDVVKVSGSGCRAGSAAVAVSADNTAFTVTYSGYLAQVGNDVKKKAAQKNCNLRLKVGVPKGFTYAIDHTDYRGFAHLEAGATGAESASYSFQGASGTVTMNHAFNGPLDDDWQLSDPTSAIFEPCGKQRALTIDTSLAVDAGTSDPKATNLLAMDSTDGGLRTTYSLAWKAC